MSDDVVICPQCHKTEPRYYCWMGKPQDETLPLHGARCGAMSDGNASQMGDRTVSEEWNRPPVLGLSPAETDALLAVARLYVDAFEEDEMMSLPQRMRLQEIEDILERHSPAGYSATAVTHKGLSPAEVERCVRAVLPSGDYDALQILMLGPDAAEVKVRSTDGRWFTGVVTRTQWQGSG